MPRLEVRCTDDEMLEWKSKAEAAGTTVSDLVRQSLGRVQTWTAADRSAVKELSAEVGRVGNNLNQIARWCNEHKAGAESVQVLAALADIESALAGISDAH